MKYFYTILFLLFVISSAFAQPSNNDCSTAELVNVGTPGNCGSTVNGTLVDATNSGLGGGTCIYNTLSEDVWYKFIASSEIVKLDILSSVTTNFLTVFENECYNLSEIECFSFSQFTSARYFRRLTLNETYYIRIQRVFGTNAAFSFCLEEVDTAPNNTCATSTNVSIGPSCGPSQQMDMVKFFDSEETYPSCTGFSSKDGWYDFTAPPSGVIGIVGLTFMNISVYILLSF